MSSTDVKFFLLQLIIVYFVFFRDVEAEDVRNRVYLALGYTGLWIFVWGIGRHFFAGPAIESVEAKYGRILYKSQATVIGRGRPFEGELLLTDGFLHFRSTTFGRTGDFNIHRNKIQRVDIIERNGKLSMGRHLLKVETEKLALEWQVNDADRWLSLLTVHDNS